MSEAAVVENEHTVSQMAAEKKSGRRVILGTGIGNALEWFDWAAYAIFAPFFAKQFFDPAHPNASFLSTLAVFAVGFVMRPLGSVLFGWLADRTGRRVSLTSSMGLVAFGSLMIGLSPTHADIGPAAAIILLIARLLQGVGHGGEVVASYTYVAEMAPASRRGLWASTIYVFVTIGVMAATLLGAFLTKVVGAEALTAWGWRVPFLTGALVGVYAIWLRGRLNETPAFNRVVKQQTAKSERTSVWRGIRENRGATLRIICLTAGGSVFYYVWAISAPGFAIGVKGMNPQDVLTASIIANLVFVVALPVCGALSDRFGRRTNFIAFAIGTIVLSYPLVALVQDQPWQLCVAMSVALILIALPSAIIPAYFSEMFPTGVRATGVGLPYSLAAAIFGGTAPYLQAWLTTNGRGALFTAYVILLAVVALIAALISPETKGREL